MKIDLEEALTRAGADRVFSVNKNGVVFQKLEVKRPEKLTDAESRQIRDRQAECLDVLERRDLVDLARWIIDKAEGRPAKRDGLFVNLLLKGDGMTALKMLRRQVRSIDKATGYKVCKIQ
jgi:hypothetical protein